MAATGAVRVEHDLVGDRQIPADVRYGVHAVRAAENFARPSAQLLRDIPEFCQALAMVKVAAARANVQAGELPLEIGEAIAAAAEEMIRDSHDLRLDLIVPLIQGGAGTSTNMNVNEVLANRALEHLGHRDGDYQHCHPNDHVNRSQSTNDVYPTALRIALIFRAGTLEVAAKGLEQALREVARDHAHTRKLGRTQLQDAVSMTVGEEFVAWADAVCAAREVLVHQRLALLAINLGGTAIGTGLTASVRYREHVIGLLAQATGLPVRSAPNSVSATTDSADLLGYSAGLRGLAVALAKVANDLRLLSSGPAGGLGELSLPAVQSGSSMMPGKVNPVIAEFVNQVAFRVRGSDAAVTAALDAAQLQLNAMLPLVASELLNAQEGLTCAMTALTTRCISGISVNDARATEFAQHSLGELSAIASRRGYVLATQQAAARGQDLQVIPRSPDPGWVADDSKPKQGQE